ncbi:IQ motif and ubiquitin-like domain-containing protein [Musca autumnalis]|uniref:IQ motif and ubiquitin-like domain-containing protein n=1 Tax=Musca autumnalis TaxID=221902 RepID=UPI003CF53A2A
MSGEYKLPTISEVVLNPTTNPPALSNTPIVEFPSSSSSKPTPSPVAPSSKATGEDEQDEIVTIENVTVKFRLAINQVIAQIYPNCMTLGEVKIDIGRRFEVAPELLKLTQNNRIPADECRIRDTECDEFGIHEFGLSLKVGERRKNVARNEEVEENEDDEERTKEPKLDLEVYYNKHRLPDFITVYIPPEDSRNGKPKNIVVEILNKAISKPFLCGYVDKNTGIEYLDAFTQTGPFINKCKYDGHLTRDTQTFEHKVKLVDTMHDQTSQCWLDGNNVRYWSEATDYYITAGKYVTHAQQERIKNKLGKICLIQRNFRRYKWMKWMRQCAQEYRRLVANRQAEDDEFQEVQERRIKREERAKLFPRTQDDFDLLYGEVQKWKMAELKRIASMYEGPARVAEVNILLDKEIQLLNGIERQRQIVSEAMKDFRQEQMLKKLGEPIKWVGYGDTVIHMDLLRTQRVRFLTEIYKDLQKPLKKAERLELITKVRQILVNEQDFPDFGELFDLFDRERNLLVYTKHCDVEILRKRQNILFVELIKFDREPKKHKQGNRMCWVCKQVKPYSQFAIRTRQFQVDTCKKCYYLKVASTENVVYTAILRSIQRDERKKHCSSSLAFIMQVDDIRHIVDQIWHGHSVLSKCNNLSRLRLPRWNKSEEWSPWNCVCLTDTEARNHNRVEDLESVYDLKTRLEVANRHMLAKNAFHNLASVSVEFTETGQWWNVGLNRQRHVRVDHMTSGGKGIDMRCKESAGADRNYTLGKIM